MRHPSGSWRLFGLTVFWTRVGGPAYGLTYYGGASYRNALYVGLGRIKLDIRKQ